MTSYQCPSCKKYLVAEEEPPGIIHTCDDCGERMTPDEQADKFHLCVTCGHLKHEDLFREGACTCEDCKNEGREAVNFREAPDGVGFVASDLTEQED